jgi:hypothetical protein
MLQYGKSSQKPKAGDEEVPATRFRDTVELNIPTRQLEKYLVRVVIGVEWW